MFPLLQQFPDPSPLCDSSHGIFSPHPLSLFENNAVVRGSAHTAASFIHKVLNYTHTNILCGCWLVVPNELPGHTFMQ